ncbi:YgiT-type zinc finger domain-containing protein [Marinospirillum celere]|uniref:YgiT-type zinc finger domain-containing protein n=1 Tax=Marinospirillum celere TaxID=1122252 RepID=A0A1I1IKW9_9GAMM|nr:YgiT-type zinc finger domain-containing protein [Marinospirillum celere]
MKCVTCKVGSTQPGKTTVRLNRTGIHYEFHGIPALICQNCGEYYLDEKTTKKLLVKAEQNQRKL